MSKLIKLLILILVSLSVNYIYKYTKNSSYIITNISDSISITSNTPNYIEYLKKEKQKEIRKVQVINKYTKTDQSMNQLLLYLENTPDIKRVLSDTDLLIINLGYNDLIYQLSILQVKDKNNMNKTLKQIAIKYDNLIREIQKYYHNEIIVIGYYENIEDTYINEGIKKLNKTLKTNSHVNYIDTYYLLSNKEKFLNNDRKKPNSTGFKEISNKIISKTLEIS